MSSTPPCLCATHSSVRLVAPAIRATSCSSGAKMRVAYLRQKQAGQFGSKRFAYCAGCQQCCDVKKFRYFGAFYRQHCDSPFACACLQTMHALMQCCQGHPNHRMVRVT